MFPTHKTAGRFRKIPFRDVGGGLYDADVNVLDISFSRRKATPKRN
ncbi:MAG: hypothetical protein ACLRSW_03430 [Christensenellaceae bacterium]